MESMRKQKLSINDEAMSQEYNRMTTGRKLQSQLLMMLLQRSSVIEYMKSRISFNTHILKLKQGRQITAI